MTALIVIAAGVLLVGIVLLVLVRRLSGSGSVSTSLGVGGTDLGQTGIGSSEQVFTTGQIQTGGKTIPMSGEAMTGLLGALEKAGALNPGAMQGQAQVIDASNVPGLRDAVMKALDANGIDAVHEQAGGHPATPFQSPGAESRSESERLSKLGELRDSGLISSADYEQQKARILGEL